MLESSKYWTNRRSTKVDRYHTIFMPTFSAGDKPHAAWPDNRKIILFGGQSNAAQYMNSLYSPTHAARMKHFLPADGTLREFVEPLFGPNGKNDLGNYNPATTYELADQVTYDGTAWQWINATPEAGVTPGTDETKWVGSLVGSLFGFLGDELYNTGMVPLDTAIIWALMGIGGTEIANWNSTGIYCQNITTTIHRLVDLGYIDDVVCFNWMQGEADAFFGTTYAEYYERGADWINMIRLAGYNGPIFIARMTRLTPFGIPLVSAEVTSAQSALANDFANVYQGPYFDDLENGYRYALASLDYSHFNGLIAGPTPGRATVSARWRSAWAAIGIF